MRPWRVARSSAIQQRGAADRGGHVSETGASNSRRARRRAAVGALVGAFSLVLLPQVSLGDDATLEEVVVTAQKREQNLIDVPIAVTALNAAYLSQREINSVDKLNGLAPGLVVAPYPTQPNGAQVGIRGSVQQNGDIVLDPSVGMYLNGVYIGKAQGAAFEIDDLERIEVLRGPQGTLYGRNTLEGAINFITNKPNDKFSGSAELGYGNYNAQTARAMLNVPISDNLFVRLAGTSIRQDGNVRLVGDPYLVNGVPLSTLYNNSVMQDPFGAEAKGGRLGDEDHVDFLGQIRFLPTEHVTLDYMLDYSRARDTPVSSQLQSVDPTGFLGGKCPYGPSVCIPAYLYLQPNYSSTAYNDIAPQDYLTITGHSLTATWDLGAETLKSITGYRTMSYDGYPDDLDGTPLWLGTGGFLTSYESVSQEFQLTGKVNNWLNYVGGLYYFYDNGATTNPQSFFFGSVNYATAYGGTTHAGAAYGQADFAVTDKFTITGGLRYTLERRTIERHETLLPDTVLVDVDGASHRFHALNPTVIFAYKFSNSLNAYAKYAQGYRSGGFNGEAGSNEATITPFNAETVDSYEIGLKSSLWDNRIDANIAAFIEKHKNMQLSVFTAISSLESLIQNAGSATMSGVELETAFYPVDALRFTANLAYLNAKYDSYYDTDSSGQVVDVADNRVIPHAPKWQASGGLDWRLFSAKRGDTLHFIVDARYSTSFYLYPYAKIPTANFPLVSAASEVQAEALGLVDTQLRWENIPIASQTGWLSVWCKNIGNTEKKLNGIDFGPSFGELNIAQYNLPRTYGVSAGLKW
jgi:iron complex outermembrane recepter protein